MEQEPEQLPDLHVSQMSQEDLDHLSAIFTEDGYQYANFKTLCRTFLREDPDPERVLEFFEEVEDLGYYIKEQ